MATGLRGAGGNYGAGSNRYGSDPKLGGGGKGSGSSRGTGGGSKASGSPSGGVSTGGGMRGAGSNYGAGSGRPGTSSGGSRTNTPAGAGGQRGAGSNYGPGSGRPGMGSAFGNVTRQAQNNAWNTSPVSMSGRLDNGYYHSFTNNLPGMNNPNQFDRTISRSNMVNAAHVPMDTYSNGYNPNSLTAGAQKLHQAIVDNAFRTNTPVDFFSGKSHRDRTKQHPAGEAIDIRLRDPLTGAWVGTPQIGERFARNPIGNVNYKQGRTPQKAAQIQAALSGPYGQFAQGTINSFMTNPGVYGEFNNQRWGGVFQGKKPSDYGLDYMHFDEGQINPLVGKPQSQFRREAANYRGPSATGGYGGIGGIPGGTQVAGLASAGIGQADALERAKKASQAASAMQGIPQPTSVGITPGPYVERTVSPRHWGREEVDYLTKIGALDRIKRNPTEFAGYRAMQNPDGSGLRIGSNPGDGNLGLSSGPESPIQVSVGQNPFDYGGTVFHELGHVGSNVNGTYRTSQMNEEVAQRLDDLRNYPPGSKQFDDAATVLDAAHAQSYVRAGTSPRDYDPLSSVNSSGPAPSQPEKREASRVVTDPRVALTPLGNLPAAKPPKEIKLAWNVPPMGGSVPSKYGDLFGVWGSNRPLPKGPAATPGTIHSQTADAAPSGSWMDGIKKQAQNLGLDPNKVITVGTDAVKKLADGNKRIAAAQQTPWGRLALSIMGAGGGGPGAASNSAFGNPQDRRPPYYPPVMSQPQQVAEVPQQTDPLSTLNNLMANMRAKGATPQQIAYVQTLIDDLMKAQVA